MKAVTDDDRHDDGPEKAVSEKKKAGDRMRRTTLQRTRITDDAAFVGKPEENLDTVGELYL